MVVMLMSLLTRLTVIAMVNQGISPVWPPDMLQGVWFHKMFPCIYFCASSDLLRSKYGPTQEARGYLSPTQDFTCLLFASIDENDVQHFSHCSAICPKCFFTCSSNRLFLWNPLKHWSHLNGKLFPWKPSSCRFKLCLYLNWSPQWEHTCVWGLCNIDLPRLRFRGTKYPGADGNRNATLSSILSSVKLKSTSEMQNCKVSLKLLILTEQKSGGVGTLYVVIQWGTHANIALYPWYQVLFGARNIPSTGHKIWTLRASENWYLKWASANLLKFQILCLQHDVKWTLVFSINTSFFRVSTMWLF